MSDGIEDAARNGRMKGLTAALILVLVETSVVAAWSSPAHRAIGEAAQIQLTAPGQRRPARIL